MRKMSKLSANHMLTTEKSERWCPQRGVVVFIHRRWYFTYDKKNTGFRLLNELIKGLIMASGINSDIEMRT